MWVGEEQEGHKCGDKYSKRFARIRPASALAIWLAPRSRLCVCVCICALDTNTQHTHIPYTHTHRQDHINLNNGAGAKNVGSDNASENYISPSVLGKFSRLALWFLVVYIGNPQEKSTSIYIAKLCVHFCRTIGYMLAVQLPV